MISKKDLEYLKNKHRGGRSNEKGNQYESFYAIRVLSNLLNRYQTDLSSVKLQSQVPLAFVDDLLIVVHDRHTYHQIKDVKKLTWKTGKSHSIEYDFKRQRSLCRKKGENFYLKLVYSNDSDKIKIIPRGLGKCTSVEHFPATDDLNSLLLSEVGFQNDLRLLLYNGLALPLDKLLDLSTCLLGIWKRYSSGTIVSLQMIDQALSRIDPGYIGNVSATVSPECDAVFQSIGVNYWVTGSNVNIQWGPLEASFKWSSDLQDLIVSSNPQTPIDLFNMAK